MVVLNDLLRSSPPVVQVEKQGDQEEKPSFEASFQELDETCGTQLSSQVIVGRRGANRRPTPLTTSTSTRRAKRSRRPPSSPPELGPNVAFTLTVNSITLSALCDTLLIDTKLALNECSLPRAQNCFYCFVHIKLHNIEEGSENYLENARQIGAEPYDTWKTK